ncbi:hypothetical protein DENIS_0335 [Desulfonema ishimotonii]|uniref:DUF7674 domain-containing protein n=1 Tax=Desulfonema ishimotonii TaxID=45657 RepID=A0A401FR05_9BACT|nr:hypothetical protein [Desulfonema ishimotonii]GBC59396.1 hypothetical protein DENIS_0335 [Desulfonema ishimotonii]
MKDQFVEEVLRLFPGAADELSEYDGLLHLQMGVFERHMTEAIERRDREVVVRGFMLAEKCYRQGDEEMKDAVDVSFAEGVLALLSPDAKAWGWSLMPKLLRQLYTDFWDGFSD